MRDRLFIYRILCLCVFVSISPVYAYEDEGFLREREKVINKTLHSLELGTEISYIKYKEPDVMREKGMMYGIVCSYTHYGLGPLTSEKFDVEKCMLKIEARGAYGKVDYRNSGVIDNIEDYLIEVRGLIGYDFLWLEKTTLTPYLGIGYRYLNDDLGGKISSTGAYGYERESNYFYGPLGIEGIIDLRNNWSFGAKAEYDIFFSGKQISHLSDVDPGYNDPKNKQKKGYGLRGSFILQKKNENLDFLVEPFIRYWSIRKSKDADLTYYGTVIGYGYEPKNNSTELGIRLAVKF